VPVQVSNLTGVIAITAYSAGSIALKNDGTVWTFGSNLYGLLGNGTLIPESNLPVQVSNLTGITAIAAGFSHGMALKNDGTLWAWGYNSAGELGNGTTQNETNIPIQVSGIAGVVAIGGGGTHALALQNDGRLFAWGYGYNGQIGNGSNLNENSLPVQINASCYPITTAIKENATTTSLAIYPNPANDKVFINGLTNPTNFQIYDGMGKLIITTTLMGKEGIDITHLNRGVYFVLMVGENGDVVSGRFLKG
jgi:alpha-tubulin suppressor-like RCC1 family protein